MYLQDMEPTRNWKFFESVGVYLGKTVPSELELMVHQGFLDGKTPSFVAAELRARIEDAETTANNTAYRLKHSD